MWCSHLVKPYYPPDRPANSNIQERLTAWFVGSGDPEVEDAVDPCEFLTQTYGHDPDSLMRDLAACASAWKSWTPLGWVNRFRVARAVCYAIDDRHWCLVWGVPNIRL